MMRTAGLGAAVAERTKTGMPGATTPGLMDVDGQLVAHNIWVNGTRTSVRLEPVMWSALTEVATLENMTIHQLVTHVAQRRHPQASLTATIRAFLVAYYRARAQGARADDRSGRDNGESTPPSGTDPEPRPAWLT